MRPSHLVLLAALAAPPFAHAQRSDPLPPPPLVQAEEELPEQPSESPPPTAPPVERPAAEATPKPAPGSAPAGQVSLLGRGEHPDVFARGELVVGQTIHGLLQAAFLCAVASCFTPQHSAGAFLLGGLIGGGASFYLSDGISGGPALAVNTGTLYGLLDGLMALALLRPAGARAPFALLSATTLLGTAGGVAIGVLLHPTQGQVAMASSAGLWTGALTMLLLGPVIDDLGTTFWGLELTAVNLGLAAGAWLSTRYALSRGRVFLIDVGGVIGGLLGVAAFYFAGFGAGDTDLLGPITGVGVAGGLAGAYLLTRNVDAPRAPQAALMPSLLPSVDGAAPALAFGGWF